MCLLGAGLRYWVLKRGKLYRSQLLTPAALRGLSSQVGPVLRSHSAHIRAHLLHLGCGEGGKVRIDQRLGGSVLP